jgi:hypothetical protein
MSRSVLAWPALAWLTMLPVGCDRTAPTAPTAGADCPTTSVSPAEFPPVSGAARIYGAPTPHIGAACLDAAALASRLVLYDDRAFALQYGRYGATVLPGEYRGTYRETASAIDFAWYTTTGAWSGTGALAGRTLSVRFRSPSGTELPGAVYTLIQ